MANKTNHFKVIEDNYGGVTIKSKEQKFKGPEEFDKALTESIPKWKTDGLRGLWAKIYLKDSSLVPVFTKHGFDFHHAKPGYVMMAKWLPEGEEDRIPPYANHYLGVAGFVVNSKNQILVIQEKYARVNDIPRWKLPGGHADTGEDIAETAKREVLEETGVHCEFDYVICFRHQHNYRYGLDDFYFICKMHPTSEDISKCDMEIANCTWMDFEEYEHHPSLSSANRHIVQCYKDGIYSHGNLKLSPQGIPALYNKEVLQKFYSITETS